MKRLHGLAAGLLLSLLLAIAPHAQAQPVRLHAAGTPEAMGKALGKHRAQRIRFLQPFFVNLGVYMRNTTKAELYRMAKKLSAKVSPEDIAEMKGMAEGSGLAYEDILYLNMFYSITTGAVACRQLAAWGPASADGKLVHARNLDWFDYPGGPLQSNHLIVNYSPNQKRPYLALTWPGLSCVLTGTNRDGITIAFNQLPGRAAVRRVAEPTTFTIKRALRSCKTLAEVEKLFKDTRPLDNGSVMVSSAAESKAAVIEIYNGQVGVRYAAKDATMIGNANHATKESGLTNAPFYGDPAAPTCHVATGLGRPLTPKMTEQVLRHPRVLQGINLLSVVFLPHKNEMRLSAAAAPAASKPFKAYKLFPEKKPAP